MSGPLLLPTWEQLRATHPALVATMRRYLEQVACVLRPGSVKGADLALRSFTAFLVENSPQLVGIGEITRRHIEDFKPWLTKRPGQNRPRMSPATLAHRLGTLRMFFVRIEEWGWEEAPPRIPMFPGLRARQVRGRVSIARCPRQVGEHSWADVGQPAQGRGPDRRTGLRADRPAGRDRRVGVGGVLALPHPVPSGPRARAWSARPRPTPSHRIDLPKQDHPLPKALDDATAAKLLRSARNDKRLLVHVTVEVLLRTGLRVSEFTGLRADAVVQIGAGPWLHVPVGKLHEDRYLPLHPQLVELIDRYRTAHVPAGHPLLLPRENGRALDRHTVTRFINKAGAVAGLPHIHPHQLRHTLATQAINRGMSLEAIAAMLGHRSLDMTLRYAKIANRTVADEYFAVTEKVESLYQQPNSLPADAIGPKMARLRREHHRLLGNGYCTRPPELDCAFESICETCTFFQTSIEFRPTLQAQRDHADTNGQDQRAALFTALLNKTDGSAAS